MQTFLILYLFPSHCNLANTSAFLLNSSNLHATKKHTSGKRRVAASPFYALLSKTIGKRRSSTDALAWILSIQSPGGGIRQICCKIAIFFPVFPFGNGEFRLPFLSLFYCPVLSSRLKREGKGREGKEIEPSPKQEKRSPNKEFFNFYS